jgi:polar amino acid transport system substrate-binding protein
MISKVKLLYVLVIAVLVLSACAAPTTPAPAATKPVAVAAATATSKIPDAPAAIEPGKCLGTAEKALVDLKCKEIKIAVENAYPPFNYITISTGKPAGWDYDAWNEICTRLHCTPKFIESAWEGMIQAVADGQFDAGADGVTINDERKQKVDFSVGYVKIDQRLLVRKGETRFKSIEDFAKVETLVMGTQTGTTNYETAVKFLPEKRIKAFEQFPFAVQALISKDVDAVIMDETAGQGYMGENADKVELIGPSISGDQLGFLFPKGSALVAQVNQALKAMATDGTLDKINTKFFGSNFKSLEADIKK